MDIHIAMKVFVAVAEHKGFSSAGRLLEMSSTAVSRHVGELEKLLGVQLLARTTRTVNLTEAGELYLEGARRVLTQTLELHSEVSSLNETPRGRLRITAPPGFGNYFLEPFVVRFAQAYPTLSVDLDISERLIDLIAEGYDVGIRSGNLRDSTMKSRRITEFHYITCASPEYIKQNGNPSHPGELTEHDCIHWRCYGGKTIWPFRNGEKLIEVPVTGRFRVNSVVADYEAALAGLGVAMLPANQVGKDLENGNLVRVLEAYPPAHELITLVWPSGVTMPRKLRVFVDYLVKEVASAEL